VQAEHWLSEALPNEGCGFLLGEHTTQGAQVQQVLGVANASASPTRFSMSAQALYHIYSASEQGKLSLLAVFHSHPTGDCLPSATDLAEARLPRLHYLIAAPNARGAWQWQNFQILSPRLFSKAKILLY
jgi:proteasome lid subunit RPN8/RPN11